MRKRLDGKLNGFYGPSDFASGPALLRALSQQPCALIVLDEATKMFRRYRGGPDPILDGKKDVLMELHSNTGMIYRKSYADAKNNIEILNPCVSVTGNATPVIFDSIKQEDFDNGMMQRFDFFCYDGLILERGRMTPADEVDSITSAVSKFLSINSSQLNSPVETGFTADADKILEKWSKQITAEANQADEGGERGIISRKYESCIKYAMIHHASANGPEKLAEPLSAASLQWGIETAKMLADWKLNVLPKKVTAGDFHRDCELFKDAIRAVLNVKKRPTIQLMKVRKTVIAKWKPRELAEIIEALEGRGEIVIDESGRKPAYYLANGQFG
jgi:hypothetical protein